MTPQASTSALKPRAAKGTPPPSVLLSYQQEAIQLSHQTGLFVCEKSRRTGLTYGFAADAVLTASAAKGGMDFFYIAYNLDMTREFIDYCGTFAKAFNQAASTSSEFLFDDGSETGIKAFRIDFPSGHSIVALSSKPRSLRGKQGVVLIDEAAFHDQLDELLKASMALLMWGGRVIVISTHDGADNAFNTLIEDIRAKKRDGIVMRLTLKDALSQGLYRRICLVTGKLWSQDAETAWEAGLRAFYADAAEEELDVIPARGSGTYMARATILAAMSTELPVVRLRCPDGFERLPDEQRTDFVLEFLEKEVRPYLADFDPTRRTFMGQDFARSGDVSPIMFGQHDALMRLVTRLTLEMRNVPFREQELIANWLIARVPHFAGGKMDARGNGSALAEAMQQKWGFDVIEAVQASDKTYLALMPQLRAGIEDRTMMIPFDEGVLEDFRMVKLVNGVPKIPERSVVSKADGAKGKRHGDTAIAAMHLISAANDDPGDLEFHSIGVRATTEVITALGWSGFGSVGRRASYGA